MSKVQEYLKNKEIAAKGYPTMYVVKSTPEGVDEPVARKVVDIKFDAGKITYSKNKEVFYDKYYLDECFPYEVNINHGDISASQEGHGSGFGDLWSWTYFSTTSKTVAENYFIKESKRVSEKYLNK